MNHFTAIGDPSATLNVYVEKAPPFEAAMATSLPINAVYPLSSGDIEIINQTGGNGWRKVFNVYAKVLFALPESHPLRPSAFTRWQDFRDDRLLQKSSDTALFFGEVDIPQRAEQGGLHIIAGRIHCKNLGLAGQFVWLNEAFAVHKNLPVYVCPYFDYRQLSNARINTLVTLIS
ncbi:DUF6942 family protein [Veronia pacifica]|uniref:Uncharacterized protein n=1 Tax=Veronia pacifica TaxID=1080227 RepID=A0A1C3EPT2_9GAMM|nr:hypothetical protein [Veronia pacifica]ODA35243.1 hypothetical protein A8L45_04850 [Veronia pacifica]